MSNNTRPKRKRKMSDPDAWKKNEEQAKHDQQIKRRDLMREVASKGIDVNYPVGREQQIRGYFLFGKDDKDYTPYRFGLTSGTLLDRGAVGSTKWPLPPSGTLLARTAFVFKPATEQFSYTFHQMANASEYAVKNIMKEKAEAANDEEAVEIWKKYVAGQANPYYKKDDAEILIKDPEFLKFIEDGIEKCLLNPMEDRFDDKNDKYECPEHDDCISASMLDRYNDKYQEKHPDQRILLECDNGAECMYVVGYKIIKGIHGREGKLEKRKSGRKSSYCQVSHISVPDYQSATGTYMTIDLGNALRHMKICDEQRELRAAFEL